jgi:hypothetical protein
MVKFKLILLFVVLFSSVSVKCHDSDYNFHLFENVQGCVTVFEQEVKLVTKLKALKQSLLTHSEKLKSIKSNLHISKSRLNPIDAYLSLFKNQFNEFNILRHQLQNIKVYIQGVRSKFEYFR